MFHTQDDPVTFGGSGGILKKVFEIFEKVSETLKKVSLSKPTELEIHLWTSNNELYWTYGLNAYDLNSYDWNPYNEIQLWYSLQRELQAECSSLIWGTLYC